MHATHSLLCAGIHLLLPLPLLLSLFFVSAAFFIRLSCCVKQVCIMARSIRHQVHRCSCCRSTKHRLDTCKHPAAAKMRAMQEQIRQLKQLANRTKKARATKKARNSPQAGLTLFKIIPGGEHYVVTRLESR